MKTILVPTDFAPAAEAARKFAQNLAKKYKSSIILLHVIEAVDEGSFNIEGEAVASGSWEDKLFNMKMIEKSKRQLAQVASALIQDGVNTKTVLRVGDAYHGIQTIITEQKADLVVMGTEGSIGVSHVLVGSNTEKVVRRSACPVISVNRNTNAGDLKSIVWATSLKAEDFDIPDVLHEMIGQEGVTVHLVRINTPGVFMSDAIAKEKLKSVAEFMKFKNYTINIYNDYEETTGIIRFAASVNADLIALSTHGRQGLAHLISGSIAEDVINHTKRPVMTYVVGRGKR
jgi:nucleotide-binding universal stress UspA family protein